MFESLVMLASKYRVPWTVTKYLSPQASNPRPAKILDKSSSPHPNQRTLISSPPKKTVGLTRRKFHLPDERTESRIAAHGVPYRIDVKKYKRRRLLFKRLAEIFDGTILFTELSISPGEIQRRDIVETGIPILQVTQLQLRGFLRNPAVTLLTFGSENQIAERVWHRVRAGRFESAAPGINCILKRTSNAKCLFQPGVCPGIAWIIERRALVKIDGFVELAVGNQQVGLQHNEVWVGINTNSLIQQFERSTGISQRLAPCNVGREKYRIGNISGNVFGHLFELNPGFPPVPIKEESSASTQTIDVRKYLIQSACTPGELIHKPGRFVGRLAAGNGQRTIR